MARTIDYFFVCLSPWAYLGHQLFHDIAHRHDVTINYRPMLLGQVWQASGSVPLAQRSATRQRYRNIEMQRYAELRRLPLNLAPKFFPVDGSLADRIATAITDAGADPSGFVWRAHQGVWVNDEDLADRTTLAAWLRETGHDADAMLAAAGTERITAVLEENSADAVAADLIGAPGYVLDGEAFWGQDRLDLLDHALTSGRKPYRA